MLCACVMKNGHVGVGCSRVMFYAADIPSVYLFVCP